MTLAELNNQYTNNFQSLIETPKRLHQELVNYKFDLSKREITDAVIQRMDMNWWYAEEINNLLERKKKPSSADYFTESCLYFLKAYFKSEGDIYQVRSEHSVNKIKSRNIVKPDISIWKDNTLLGAIELKTLNEWFRHTWRTDFENRENQLKQVSGNPNLIFCSCGILELLRF